MIVLLEAPGKVGVDVRDPVLRRGHRSRALHGVRVERGAAQRAARPHGVHAALEGVYRVGVVLADGHGVRGGLAHGRVGGVAAEDRGDLAERSDRKIMKGSDA